MRVAYFPDSFHEINGVAHTSRHFEAYARRHNLPFLCVRAGDRSKNGQPRFVTEGSVSTLELPRGFLSFALDKDLSFDPGFFRHFPAIVSAVKDFRPDIIHITGPSELGMIGAMLANHLYLPTAASWHTNVHEYLAKRSHWLLGHVPQRHSAWLAQKIEDTTLAAAARFYQTARILFAPNCDLCKLLDHATGKPCYLMQRGVDTHLFSPARRDRDANDKDFVLGFVGRLSIEKNVALLVQIQQQLEAQGIHNFRFLIVGQGIEEPWLRQHLPRAEFTGVLRGESLARAYANMDLFVFPSHTDTFGNVVLEALASAVPAIVTPDGGPKYIIQHGITGLITEDADFTSAIAGLFTDPQLHKKMRTNAREDALTTSWDAVFDGVYEAYSSISGNLLKSGNKPK